MEALLIGILASLVLSAWFAGAETTFLSFNKARLQAWLQRGVRGARTVDFLYRDPERFLISTLTGNNLVNVLYSSLAALWLTLHGISEEVVLVVTPLVLLVFGETIPKAAARQLADRIVPAVGIGLFGFRLVVWPMVKLAEIVVNAVQRRLGLSQHVMGRLLRRADIVAVFEEAGREGDITEDSQTLIRRMFRASELRVKEIMTPRTAVVALKLDTPVSEARGMVIESGFTRMPCYRDTIDDVVGVVVAHDLLTNPPDLESVMRPLPLVPDSLRLVYLPHWFRKHRTLMAGVIDEFGGLAGVVSVEDLIEELVGPISDEYDSDDPDCIRLSDRVWLARGHIRLSHLIQRMGIEQFRSDARSLGGFITKQTGGIPEVGAEFDHPTVRLRVIRADQRGVDLVRIYIKENMASDENHRR